MPFHLVYVGDDGQPTVFSPLADRPSTIIKLIDYLEIGFLCPPGIILTKSEREEIEYSGTYILPNLGGAWYVVEPRKLL